MRCLRWVLPLLLIALVPGAAGIVWGIPPDRLLSLAGATFVIEYGAAAVGTGLGIDPAAVLLVNTSIAAGVILFSFAVFDTLAGKSRRVATFLERSWQKHHDRRILQVYGVLALVPGIIVVGFYVCPAVAWYMGWDRRSAILLMLAGYLAAGAATLAAAAGVIGLLP